MGDDLVTDGILPIGSVTANDDEDPNMVESDDFLDDPAEDTLLADVPDAAIGVVADEDEDDDLLGE
ncbi:MAG: hypothetical protein A3B16_00625 [Candidatus Zambryskibacteria bacterium RIFCSPLOWO2_01_FULL_45_43]|uniref:Uncharacterized protein n=1 Tax=Candidatus Zambryskibacteria bacterium RIFCSPLOWO2_01_FULL_45_43 TaxID=1802762 RepID=A0A1G2U8G6_9BACT|nr:MAG: hypothetical protein A3B16_00625 [Candidatus Zambryskibacteria bacterium RIFCSPLOWO2_01_FULL_45_43]